MTNEELLIQIHGKLDEINRAHKLLNEIFKTNCLCFRRSDIFNFISIIKTEVSLFDALFQTLSNQIYIKYKVESDVDYNNDK